MSRQSAWFALTLTSQAAQFSVMSDLQPEPQRRAVRTSFIMWGGPGSILPENQIEKLGTPKLVILPHPRTLTEKTWHFLMGYVKQGGNLLLTGPVEHDKHWHRVCRAVDFGAQPLR